MKQVIFEIFRIVGVLAILGVIALWLIYLFANPYGTQGFDGAAALTVGVTLLLASLGLLASLAGRGLWVAFFAAAMFVPTGFYVLGTPGFFLWIGILELIFLAAGVGMSVTRAPGRS
ncbi:MAG: hypothetical protein ACK2UW_12470 [Anaerolineales bacterium]|jgi:magnesium-transporting ATPase (P-type)